MVSVRHSVPLQMMFLPNVFTRVSLILYYFFAATNFTKGVGDLPEVTTRLKRGNKYIALSVCFCRFQSLFRVWRSDTYLHQLLTTQPHVTFKALIVGVLLWA